MLPTKTISESKCLVKGYIRENYPERITKPYMIPSRMIETCLSLLLDNLYKKLTFSTKYKSDKGLDLIDDNQCVRKSDNYPRTTWILGDIEPVHDGIYCWRIFVEFYIILLSIC